MRTTHVALAVVLGPLAAANGALAQQTTPRSQSMMPAPAPQTTAAATTKPESLPQGFSVVLVMGDLQGAGSADDVPQAARKALTDMRDFLPFKSYKLLDAAWVMCCGQMGRRVNVGGGRSVRESTSVTQSLRGADDQEYELKLHATQNDGGRLFIDFELYALGINSIDKAFEKFAGERSGQRRTTFHEAPKSIIDTSFLMDVGETIVVGSSSVKGGSRALIALLTAVPARGAASTRE